MLRLRSAEPVLSLTKGSARTVLSCGPVFFPFIVNVAAAAAESKHTGMDRYHVESLLLGIFVGVLAAVVHPAKEALVLEIVHHLLAELLARPH